MKIRVLISSTDNRELYIAVTERLMRATREHPENWETVIGVPGVIDHVGHQTSTFSRVVWSREYDGGPLFRLTIRDDHPVYDDLRALIANELRPKVTPELLELSKQVLNEHGHADAMPDDPGSIAQLTVALRSLIKAVES
ncbi:hypothetical protein SEA_FREGLEY_102 [Microbacterium phage Fregley]|nr:hypothetical protein SEA_FREGLEY_102 [Microbacterium phage Fregley]